MLDVWKVAALSVVAACGGGSHGSVDAAGDGQPPIVAPPETWTWIPIPGMFCGDGSPTGVGVNLTDRSSRVAIYVNGGGACWDVNTCFTLKTAVHITGGYGQNDFNGDIANATMSQYFQRVAANPFEDASWIFVPYCTGDLHDGSRVMMYDATHTVHHVGRQNMSALLPLVAATRPSADIVWYWGISAGGYGVALDWDLARAAWPQSTVHVLADSSPLVTTEPTRYAAMQAAWQMTFPTGCTNCTTDFGAIPAALRADAPAGARYGLLADLRDSTISTYFGLTQAQLSTEITAEQSGMTPGSGQAAYVLDGTTHVMLTMPGAMTSTGVVMQTWVAQWASGDPAWANAGP